MVVAKRTVEYFVELQLIPDRFSFLKFTVSFVSILLY